MGAWGTGIYDNETALDFLENNLINLYNNADENDEYLVVLDIALTHKINPTKAVYDNYMRVIDEEISLIDEWQDELKEERLLLLNNLKTNLIELCDDGKNCAEAHSEYVVKTEYITIGDKEYYIKTGEKR